MKSNNIEPLYKFMSLPDKSIEQFKRIWKTEYDADITNVEARQYGENLVNYFKLLIELDNKYKVTKSSNDLNK